MPSDSGDALSAEDAKLVTLAKGARARISAQRGAAVRDETGRTYASADVTLPSLTLTALQLAVAQAVASGARGAEAAVIVGEEADPDGLRALADLGGGDVVVHLCAADGSVLTSTIAGA